MARKLAEARPVKTVETVETVVTVLALFGRIYENI